jgi:hypothetical protein
LRAEEAPVVVPVILPVVEVEVALRIVPVEIRDVTIAVDLGRWCARRHLCDAPLNTLGVDIVFVTLYVTSTPHQQVSDF